MICQNCGNENVDYARFCLTCGAPFQPQQLVQPPQPKIGDDPWMRALLPVGKAPLAVIAGWVGLLSLICCPILGPVAMVLSVVAIVDLNRNPDKRGKGRAIFGVVAGSIATLIAIAFLLNLRS
ncbi:MAG TPA: DUF4190 domain-containing protein [Blastocatellia bacterium]|nr:DUF4190 domain-containing protein [Blastocatellia bacterium]